MTSSAVRRSSLACVLWFCSTSSAPVGAEVIEYGIKRHATLHRHSAYCLVDMVRQQSQRRGCRSSQATSAIQHGDGDEHITNEFDEHKQALEFLAGAVDLSMVESSALARPGKLEFLGHMMLKSQRFHWLLDAAHILQLYTHAAVNSMDVILHSIKGCLLDPQHSKATSIVGGLCNSISRCITYRVDDDRAQQELHLQLAASGTCHHAG